MTFVNLQLPEWLSNGSVLGPSWNTTVQETPGGGRNANQKQTRPRWRYDIAKSLLKLEDDDSQIEAIHELVRFFNAVKGARNTWKLWDPIDNSLHQDGRTLSETATDAPVIGVGDGSETTFQIAKPYTFGGETTYRPIVLPKPGSYTVWVDEVQVTPANYSIGEFNGKLILNTAPGAGEQVRVMCHFYVHAAFTEEADRWLAIEAQNNIGSIASLPVVEVPSSVVFFDYPDAGGSTLHTNQSMTGNHQILYQQGRYQEFLNTSGSGKDLILPPKAEVPGSGGPIFIIALSSDSTSGAVIKDGDTGGTILSLAPGETASIVKAIEFDASVVWKAWL